MKLPGVLYSTRIPGSPGFTLVMGLALQGWALSMSSSVCGWWGSLGRGGGSQQLPFRPPHHILTPVVSLGILVKWRLTS